MQKKGFTLIELLGVIVVLAIILIVAVPSTIATLKRAGEKEYNAFLVNLYNATETYVELNRIVYPQLDTVGGSVNIPVQTILDQGLIKKMGIDPDTGTIMPSTYTVTATTQSDNTILYTILKKDTNIASYVQNGLVLQYDGINNIKEGHSYTATAWKDLSGNNNDGVLSNVNFDTTSGWTTNSLQLDGINDSARTASFASLTNLTFELVMLRSTANTISWTKGNDSLIIYPDGHTYVKSNSGTNTNGATFTLANDTIYTLTVVYNIATQKSLYYRNGILVQTFDLPTSSATFAFANGQNLFANWADTAVSKGRIYSTRMYNRAITAAEIVQNYALDRARFDF